jgi:hypothetical protein
MEEVNLCPASAVLRTHAKALPVTSEVDVTWATELVCTLSLAGNLTTIPRCEIHSLVTTSTELPWLHGIDRIK